MELLLGGSTISPKTNAGGQEDERRKRKEKQPPDDSVREGRDWSSHGGRKRRRGSRIQPRLFLRGGVILIGEG